MSLLKSIIKRVVEDNPLEIPAYPGIHDTVRHNIIRYMAGVNMTRADTGCII